MFYCKNLFGNISNEAEMNLLKMTVAIEFIHTATLLHDDVVDESAMRRSQPTANSLLGTQQVSLPVTSCIPAFQIMTDVGSAEIMSIMVTLPINC